MVRSISVHPMSLVSLLLEVRVNGRALSSASGFIVESRGASFLITNWHVVAGRDPDTGQLLSSTGAVPDELAIVYHRVWEEDGQRRTGWHVGSECLLNEDFIPRWLEHPAGREVDVVALPVRKPIEDVAFFPMNLALIETDIFAGVGDSVFIIGYPFGLTGGAVFPIWKAGHIASEPEIDYDNRPLFLVDATTREGMSGSPVILWFPGHGYKTRNRVEIGHGAVYVGDSSKTRFLGVYAGRIHGSAEVGRVWKPEVIEPILATWAESTPDQPGAGPPES